MRKTTVTIRDEQLLREVQAQLRAAGLPHSIGQILHACILWMHRRGAVSTYIQMIGTDDRR